MKLEQTPIAFKTAILRHPQIDRNPLIWRVRIFLKNIPRHLRSICSDGLLMGSRLGTQEWERRETVG